MVLIPAMATVTRDLCCGGTASTSYEPSYLLARRFLTLDHLTKGRVSWNVVTGILASTARAMGVGSVPHDERYDRADDYLDLVYKLWEGGWDDAAALRDRAHRIFTDVACVRKIVHHGLNRCEGTMREKMFPGADARLPSSHPGAGHRHKTGQAHAAVTSRP